MFYVDRKKLEGIQLDSVFSSGMVFQRERECSVWGWAKTNETVSIALDGNDCGTAEPDAKTGKFMLKLPAQEASTERTVTVSQGDRTITLEDVCFGDVYMLSGQSNMELMVWQVLDAVPNAANEARYPYIRQFTPEPMYRLAKPCECITKRLDWQKAVGNEVMEFSAAGYFFARRVYETKNVPIGLIQAAQGGSTVEAWMPLELIDEFSDCRPEIMPLMKDGAVQQKKAIDDRTALKWNKKLESRKAKQLCKAIPKKHETIELPTLFFNTALDGYIGSLWMYKEVTLNEQPDEDALLYLGELIDSDRAYVNGILVGSTEYRYPLRKYTVGKEVLHKGVNLIAVRLVVWNGAGAFLPEHSYYLETKNEHIELSGEWKFVRETPSKQPQPPVILPTKIPTGIYNSVMVPMKDIQFRGVLWYQGESNCEQTERYDERFAAMTNNWRRLCGQELPIICVELADYIEPNDRIPNDEGWKDIQRQQREASKLVERCVTVSAKDLGEVYEIHPRKKEELGERLAAAGLELFY